jgi:peptidoglycan-associated lipoprotein
MKYLLPFALVSLLLSGCADTPLKEASIEDRSVKSVPNQSDPAQGGSTQPGDASAVGTAGTPSAGVSSRALTEGAAKAPTSSGVETHGVVVQSPEAIPLAATGEKVAQADSAKGGSQAEHADALKFDPQQVLDPKDPKSPLAQRRLLFDYDSAAIRDEYRTLLEMHAQYLKTEKSARLILQGHADERGSREYNLALGQRRSESVYKALNLLGVPDAQMEAVSLGEEKPVSEGHDETSWAQNRRAELLYQGE